MKTKYNRSLISGKALKRYFDFNDAMIEFHNLFNAEYKDERTIAILGGTFLEMALEHVLYSFLPENEKEVENLFSFNQPLENFSSKISVSFCLGLIDRMIKDDLHCVRKIRNKFAHDLYANFHDEQIKSWTRNLKFHILSMMMTPPEEAAEIEIFKVGVNQLISHLSGCISISRGAKRNIIDTFYVS